MARTTSFSSGCVELVGKIRLVYCFGSSIRVLVDTHGTEKHQEGCSYYQVRIA
jgi:hypothetical protein